MPDRVGWSWSCLAVVAVLLVGAWLRAANLGGPAFGFDEFYHVFAAENLLAGHGFEIDDGRPYTRTRFVTLLVAGAFALFGPSEASARLPSLIFGVLTLGAVYWAGRRLFGHVAGLVAVTLLAVSPEAVDVSRFARLYSPLAFATLVAAVAAFLGVERLASAPGRLDRAAFGWLALAGTAGLLAVHLHPVALALGPVVALYAAGAALGDWLGGRRRPAARYAAIAGGLALVAVASLALPGIRRAVVVGALTPLPWYTPQPGDTMTYHYALAADYRWLWFLVWPATVIALLARPRQGGYAALAFWLPFATVSAVVATKSFRYVTHLLPFAWLLVGAGAQAVWGAAREALEHRLSAWLPGDRAPRRLLRGLAAAAVVAIALLPLFRLTPSVATAARRSVMTTGSFTTGRFVDWRAVSRVVAPSLDDRTTVVATVPLASRYYLRRPAVRLLAADRSSDAWTDAGRTVVQRAADLDRLRRDHDVVVLLESWRWEAPGKIGLDLAAALSGTCRRLPIPASADLLGFACDGGRREAAPTARH